jgi:putative membrane protein
MILFLVLNIACGFGTFPALIQFPLFNWLSYIMPFTYMMHAQGALIFNVAVGANALSASLYILQCVGILLIYPLIFYSLGLYNARRRSREIYYGSSIKKDVLDSLKRLGIEKRYLNKKGNLS